MEKEQKFEYEVPELEQATADIFSLIGDSATDDDDLWKRVSDSKKTPLARAEFFCICVRYPERTKWACKKQKSSEKRLTNGLKSDIFGR